MALRPEDEFPGKIDPADAEYPEGKARDVSAPLASDGTPWNATNINETYGFQQALLDAAGITPNALPEVVGNSQYLDAINTLIGNAVAGILLANRPIGSIYESTDPTDPGTLLGFGTWELYGVGRVVVGLDIADADFNTPGQTGGAKTHTLTEGQLPEHSHTSPWVEASNQGTDSRWGTETLPSGTGSAGGVDTDNTVGRFTSPIGSGQAHNNVQPYVVLYRWRRTA